MPKDLKISGKSEAFTAVLTYDTLDLYGKMEAALPLKIEVAEERETKAETTARPVGDLR